MSPNQHDQHRVTSWTSSCAYPNIVSNTQVVPGMCDHSIVMATVNTKPKLHPKVPHKVFVYKKANFDGLRQDTKVFVDTFLESNPAQNSVEENWTQLTPKPPSILYEEAHPSEND